ncbi:MAG: NfeD family protein [Rhodospirillaceae bacterium]|nr:NfeD family protein [Rhodospirillaceae bacterium]
MNVSEIFSAPIGYWHWWIAATILGALEMALPGVVFLWLGIAAVVNGFLILAAPFLGWTPEWGAQLLMFSVLGLVSLAAGRQLWRHRPGSTPHPTLNRRGTELIGRECLLERPIENGRGRVHLGDTLWLVSGPDLPVGTVVRVTGVDGTALMVEAVEK